MYRAVTIKARILSIMMAMLLTGCAGAALEGANIAKDKVVYESNLEEAQGGDPAAQFKVGEALCCSAREEAGLFYSTKNAIAWLCSSARQGYAPAMQMVGKIYSGDVVDGVRVIRRVTLAVANSPENNAVSYVWLRQAGDLGLEEADEHARELWEDLSGAERRSSAQMLQQGRQAQCLWDEVIGQAS